MSGSLQELERDKVKERDAVVLRLEVKIQELQKVAGLPKTPRSSMRVLIVQALIPDVQLTPEGHSQGVPRIPAMAWQ